MLRSLYHLNTADLFDVDSFAIKTISHILITKIYILDVTLATAVHWNECVNRATILEQGSFSTLLHQRQCRQRSNGNKIPINHHEWDFLCFFFCFVFLVRSNGQTCIYH